MKLPDVHLRAIGRHILLVSLALILVLSVGFLMMLLEPEAEIQKPFSADQLSAAESARFESMDDFNQGVLKNLSHKEAIKLLGKETNNPSAYEKPSSDGPSFVFVVICVVGALIFLSLPPVAAAMRAALGFAVLASLVLSISLVVWLSLK